MRTYLKENFGFLERLKEFLQLYRFHTHNQKEKASQYIKNMQQMARSIEEVLGESLKEKHILEVGPGQKLAHLYYFARNNHYVGIDIDQPMLSLNVSILMKMWRSNGFTRTLKTAGRRLLGIDKAYKKEMFQRLGITRLDAELIQMDAGRMTFEDNTFDCVFSISVFEHLPRPEGAMKEIRRVLKPGGVAYIFTHHYTSDTGIHDPRVFGKREHIPYWSHLQPDKEHLVKANCYINKMRLAEYEKLFSQYWPGSSFEYIQNDERARAALETYRSEGKLSTYTEDELMTDVLATMWKKPGQSDDNFSVESQTGKSHSQRAGTQQAAPRQETASRSKFRALAGSCSGQALLVDGFYE